MTNEQERVRSRFTNQLYKAVSGAVKGCQRIDMEKEDAVALVAMPLLAEAAVAANSIGLTKKQYLGLAMMAHAALQEYSKRRTIQ